MPLIDAPVAPHPRSTSSEADGIASNQVGSMGFAAGAHLCDTLASQPIHPNGLLQDAVSQIDCRSDLFVIINLVACLTQACSLRGSRDNRLGLDHTEADTQQFALPPKRIQKKVVTVITVTTLLKYFPSRRIRCLPESQ
ncbi:MULTISPECIES: hypothetical protein [unclassified Lentimonas]|uniref:hypothetical protein n=1 Tax=unclassified Lentimonas TaxID=2630993 RepID=UPI00138A58CA|nr:MULTISPECIES: hypothetical protein [unclassified Lentimonas]